MTVYELTRDQLDELKTTYADQIETRELWCIFSYNHKELAAYTVRGTFPGELKATKEMLSQENKIPAEWIDITYRYR